MKNDLLSMADCLNGYVTHGFGLSAALMSALADTETLLRSAAQELDKRSHAGEPALHYDDVCVNQFAAAMKAKMAHARAEGRDGWADPHQCETRDLARALRFCVLKGDPVDVANYAMMLYHRRGTTNMGVWSDAADIETARRSGGVET